MKRFILLMHGDAAVAEDGGAWGPYLDRLRRSGRFEGGSSIGGGGCFRKADGAREIPGRLVGYLLVRADDLAEARGFLDGNPTYDAGGTVELRELVED